jgi:hypothetical protein
MFRKWKRQYSEENKTLCKELLGDLLIELGYEYIKNDSLLVKKI